MEATLASLEAEAPTPVPTPPATPSGDVAAAAGQQQRASARQGPPDSSSFGKGMRTRSMSQRPQSPPDTVRSLLLYPIGHAFYALIEPRSARHILARRPDSSLV
jgi:hypothetical protein